MVVEDQVEKRRYEIADRRAYLAKLCRSAPYNFVEAVLENPVEASIPPFAAHDGTMLVASLVGFNRLCEELAHEDGGITRLTDGLNDLFQGLLEEGIFPFSGYVLSFGGDALIALFKGEGHALRAAAAAEASIKVCARVARHRLAGADLYLSAGVASGTVRLAVLGDVAQKHVLPVGAVAHLAAELASKAEPSAVLLDFFATEAIGDAARVESAGPSLARLVEIVLPPVPVPVLELGDRLATDVDRKIALLEPFVAKPLARRMRSLPPGWRVEGEYRDAVLLSLRISALDDRRMQTDPDRTLNLSRTFLRSMRKYGGMILKSELTAEAHRTLVLFGLHRPQDNDAERAVLAALEAAARLKSHAVAEGAKFEVRYGAHAGPVYFGAFGGDYRHDLTVVGAAVQKVHRLAEQARPYEVLASAAIMERVQKEFDTSVHDDGAGEVWHQVHSTSAGRSHYVRARGHARFYAGRQSALDIFDTAVDRALDDSRGTVLGLRGASGCGKSALLSALINKWTKRGGVGLIGRCRLATRSQPLAPVAVMFGNFLGLTAADSPEQRRHRIQRGLTGMNLGDGLADVAALLQPVLKPDGTSEALLDFSDHDARTRILDVVATVIEKRLDDEPVAYLLEDVHEADSLSLELIGRARQILRHRRGLLVVTYRPEPRAEGLRQHLDAEIELLPLAREATGELVAHELKAEAVEHGFLNFICARSEGNPRHIIELIRFLQERSLVTVRGGVVVAPTDNKALLSELVPQSLAQMTLARLDELGSVERALLKTASAIGTRFPQSVLEHAALDDVDPSAVHAAIANLEGDQVLVSDQEATAGWMFRDEVTRAVTYNLIPDGDRRAVHARIADALEQLDAAHPARSPTSLALHRERAGQTAAAAAWYERAARLALRAGMGSDAIAHVDRWRALQALLPENLRAPPLACAELALMKLMALGRQGVAAATMAQCRFVIAQFWDLLPEPKRRVVDFWLGDALLQAGELPRARERLARVHAYARETALRCDAAILIARSYEYTGEFDEAAQWLDQAEELVFGDPYRRLRIKLTRAHLLLKPADLEQAARIYAEVQHEAADLRHLRIEAEAINALAYNQMHRGQFGPAIEGFDDAVHKFRALSSWGDVANAQANLGQAYVWAGRHQDARPLLKSALKTAREAADELVATEAMVHLGVALAMSEDPVAGEALLRAGREKAEAMHWHEVALAAHLHQLHLDLAFGRHARAQAQLVVVEEKIEKYKTALLLTVLTQLRERMPAPDRLSTVRDLAALAES